MKILALESSTILGSVAVVIDGQVRVEKSSRLQRSHSEVLNPFVQQVLEESGLKLPEIDAFAVGQGPGSFTGIRVAANIGKSFAYTFNKPLIAIDSLVQLAAQAGPTSDSVLTIMNAYKNMVYFGVFDVSGQEPRYLEGPGVYPIHQLGTLLQQKSLVVGDGFEVYREFLPTELLDQLQRPTHPSDFPLAGTLGRLAEQRLKQGLTLDWKSFVPLYIRASEAEENKQGLLFKSLHEKDPVHGKNS